MREGVGIPGVPLFSRVAVPPLPVLAVSLCATCRDAGRDPGPHNDVGESIEEPAEDEALIVLGGGAASGLAEEPHGRVTGGVRRLDQERGTRDLTVGLADSRYMEYEGRPVVYATGVEALAGKEATGR